MCPDTRHWELVGKPGVHGGCPRSCATDHGKSHTPDEQSLDATHSLAFLSTLDDDRRIDNDGGIEALDTVLLPLSRADIDVLWAAPSPSFPPHGGCLVHPWGEEGHQFRRLGFHGPVQLFHLLLRGSCHRRARHRKVEYEQ